MLGIGRMKALFARTSYGYEVVHKVRGRNTVWVKRRADVLNFVRPGGVGVELGVAAGDFSRQLLSRPVLSKLYGVDRYFGDRGHDDGEYAKAQRQTAEFADRYSLLKQTFDEALPTFADGSLDFIYIDGYAHTGQEGGETIRQWARKVRPGGLISGDDFSITFPLVMQEVDRFVADNALNLNILLFKDTDGWSSQHPSWFCVKP